MRETHISSTELARSIGDILSRVDRQGESFVVERDGKPVAIVSPPRPPARRTLHDVLAQWQQDTAGDRGFADDLEQIGRDDRPISDPWES